MKSPKFHIKIGRKYLHGTSIDDYSWRYTNKGAAQMSPKQARIYIREWSKYNVKVSLVEQE